MRWAMTLMAEYRKLVRLRRTLPALARGGIRYAHVDADAIAYLRETPDERLLCLASRAEHVPVRVPLAIDSRAVYAAGHLLYVRDGTLLAHPFDPDTARTTGEPHPVVDDIHYFRNTGLAAFSVSENGVLAWRAPRRPSRVVWIDRAGTEVRSVASHNVFFGAVEAVRLGPSGPALVYHERAYKRGVSSIAPG